MSQDQDFIVIGAGIAGASAAYRLASQGRVALLEREEMPGYHATGRSAAIYSETYGNRYIRMLARASRAFLGQPPAGFTDHSLLTPRPVVHVGRADQEARIRAYFAEVKPLVTELELIDGARVEALSPGLRRGYAAIGILEPAAQDLDVAGLHQGYLRAAKALGAAVVCNAEVSAMAHRLGQWQVTTTAGEFRAPVVVNAAGAWADQIATIAGVRPLGLTPLRRTVITFDPPPGLVVDHWPLTVDADDQFYFKPDAGRILATPGDKTPMPPCDVQPDDLDIATAVDRIQQATGLDIDRLGAKWAGLRSFFADETPVNGFAPDAPGFFWLAGQGGYGIKTSPAMSLFAAAQIAGQPMPESLRAEGLEERDLAPERLGNSGR